jgi:hypothetical protein
MLSKRVVAIAADKGDAKRLGAGLMAAGATVETASSVDDLAKGEIAAELVVVQVGENPAVLSAVEARLKADAMLVAVIPTSSLEMTVKVMQSGRVAATLVADELEPASLAATASKLLYGDVFGLEKLVPYGVKVYSILVGDYQEKSVAIAAVSDYAGAMGVRRKYRESIEQCLDEMLMNALYDAPVDSAGKQMFADVPTKTRISLRMEQKVVVQYACDGSFFALSVRDSFGALKGDTIVKYLDKCLHSEQQIDRKAGGAGLGLYIISNAASQFFVHICPGVATEAVCTFNLNAAKVQLKEFGVFSEKIDSSGRLVAGPSKLVGAGPGTGHTGQVSVAVPQKGIAIALGAAIVLLLTLIGIVAYPRLVGPPLRDVAVATHPTGAVLELDGRAIGSTSSGPLTIEALEVGQKYKLTARLDGYDPTDEIITPQKNQSAPVVLTLHPKQATLIVETDPPGATLVIDGREYGTTPVTLASLPAHSEQKALLKKSGYADVTRTLRMPPPGKEASVLTSLVMSKEFGSITIETDPPGAAVVQNNELLAGLVTPVTEHIIKTGKPYVFTFKAPGYMPETRTIKLDAGQHRVPLRVTLKTGGGLTVAVNNVPEARVTVAGVPACSDKPVPLVDCPLPSGTYRVRVGAQRPYLSEGFTIEVKGNDVVRNVQLGFVETTSEEWILAIPGAPKGTRRAAFPEGPQKVAILNVNTNETIEKTVRVSAGRTVPVDAGN